MTRNLHDGYTATFKIDHLHLLLVQRGSERYLVEANYYHPDFHGSFSIKEVLPVLVPEMGYDDLAIAEPYLDHPRELEVAVLADGEAERLRDVLGAMLRPEGVGEDALRLTEEPDDSAARAAASSSALSKSVRTMTFPFSFQ